jgi:hypothetical protein
MAVIKAANYDITPKGSSVYEKQSWIVQHFRAERFFARALKQFFSEQAGRIAAVVRENFPSGVSPDQTPLIVNIHQEHERLQPIVRRNLSGLLIMGARTEQRAVQRRLEGKAYEDDLRDLDLPPETLAGLRRALDELEQQPYWLAIQSETETNLRAIIEQGIEDKLSNYSIGMLIRQELGGMAANKRAQRIARTESTGCLNAGHVAYMATLEATGEIVGRQWEAIGDGDTRPAHSALQNVVVPTWQPFNVGGYPAPYPGHWSLPAAQRVNCRCTVLAAFNPAFLPD